MAIGEGVVSGAVIVGAVTVPEDAGSMLCEVAWAAEGATVSVVVVVGIVAIVAGGDTSEIGRDVGVDPPNARLMRLPNVPEVGVDAVAMV